MTAKSRKYKIAEMRDVPAYFGLSYGTSKRRHAMEPMTAMQARVFEVLDVKQGYTVGDVNDKLGYGKDDVAKKLAAKIALDALVRHKRGKVIGKDQYIRIGEPDDMPDFLKVKNREPLSAEQSKKLEAQQRARVEAAKRDHRQPKGMNEAEFKKAVEAVVVPLRKPPVNEAKAARVEAKAAKKAAKKQRSSREGLIDVATIAGEFDIEARIARGILRGAKITKPDCGWAGNKTWADLIRSVLNDALASPKKSSGDKKGGNKKGRKPKLVIPPPEETTWSAAAKDKARRSKDHAKVDAKKAERDEADTKRKAELTKAAAKAAAKGSKIQRVVPKQSATLRDRLKATLKAAS